MSVHLRGVGAAPGLAVAPPFIVEPVTIVEDDGPAGPPEQEKGRLHEALMQAATELHALAERLRIAAGDEAEIFEAHAAFAEDPELEERAWALIDAGQSAVAAVVAAFAAFRELLAASTSEYLAARAADLDDVCARVTAILAGASAAPVPPVRSVLIARELTPSQTAELPRELIAAIVTETGSPTSHAAILARTLGIPAVVGAPGVLTVAAEAHLLAVDGRSGEVHLDPDAELQAAFGERMEMERERRESLAAVRDEPGRTADGVEVELVANVAGRADLDAAVAAGAQGTGLVRTELLFQERSVEPSVGEQVEYYREVLAAFPGQRVVFRTLDIGADKPMPFVPREAEPNPALGVRGVRLSLRRPKLFDNQLRALVRAGRDAAEAGEGRMAIMFPLVSGVEELRAARAETERVAADEGVDPGELEIGVMVEVPSAALNARRLAPHADFLSIGTNDLLQYLFAADRLVADVVDLADVCDPVVLDLIAEVVAAGDANGAWVGVCGEAASDPLVAGALVGLGVRELSMVSNAIGEVKDLLGRFPLDDLKAAAAAARRTDSAAAARAALATALT